MAAMRIQLAVMAPSARKTAQCLGRGSIGREERLQRQ
jgi:hypothetical protein